MIDRTWPVLPTVLKSQQIESARFSTLHSPTATRFCLVGIGPY